MPSDIRARAIDAPSSAAGSSREETRAVERDVVCAPVRVRVLPRDACVRAPRCCARATRHREDAPFQAGCPTDRNPGRPDSNPCAFPVEEINIWRKARERRRARRLTPARRRRPARTFAAHSRRRHGARSGVPRAHPARGLEGRRHALRASRARRSLVVARTRARSSPIPPFRFSPERPARRVARASRTPRARPPTRTPSRATTTSTSSSTTPPSGMGPNRCARDPLRAPARSRRAKTLPPRRTLVRIVRPVIIRPEPSPLRSST